MTIALRPFQPQDLDSVRALIREYAESLGIDLCFQGLEEELARLPGDYAPPGGALLIAHVDGMLAGCCALRLLDNVDYVKSRSAELLAAWKGCVIRQPSLFITGTRDDVLRFPGGEERLKRLPEGLPGLRGCHLVEGAGHWVQRERAAEVSGLVVEFLRGL